jgi:hypothetical protein
MENRREPRIEHKIKFFVHVHECKDNPELVGVSIECEALDFSSHGLQLRTDHILTPQTLLNITIGIGNPFAMFLLRGEVRWVRPGEDEHYMGVLFQEEDSTDLDAWVSQFESLITN